MREIISSNKLVRMLAEQIKFSAARAFQIEIASNTKSALICEKVIAKPT
jgi:hypothetical protein